MKKILFIITILLFPFSVGAINVTIPQSPAWGSIPRGNANGTYTPVATSTLGLTFSTTSSNYWLTTKTTSDLIEGTNLYYLDSRARNALSALAPISYNSGTGEISCPTCGVSTGNWATSSQDYYNSQFRDWSIVGGSLRPTTTLGVLISASSTIRALTVTNGTTTNATTINLAISSIISKILKTDTNGLIVGATAGVDYQAAGTYVTSITVSSSNGFTGSSSGGATPALTLTTSVNGVLKGNGTAISAGSDGTDYTLIDALTCGSTDKFSGVTAAGVFTCSADVSGGGASFGESWSFFDSKSYLAPTTSTPIIVNNATSTITNLQVVNGTTTNATSTNLNVLGNFTQGTTTPSKLFSVYGTQSGGIARFTRNAGNNPIAGLYGTQDVEVTGQGTIPTSGYGTAQTFSANGNILGSIGALTDGGLNTGRFVFNIYTNSVPAEVVTIRDLINSGVGIGTSTPVGALNISGGGTFGAWSQPLLVLSDMDAVADSKHLYASTTKGTLEFGSINDALTIRTQRLLLGNSTSTLVGNLTISGNSTTSQFAITGIGTCTAGQALKPSATAGLSCQAVTASASAGGNNQEVQYNDSTAIAGAGGFDFDKTTGRIEMAGGQSLADSFKYALHIATTTSPQFEVASSTADIFEAVSTTTSFEGGMFDGARVTVGTSTKSVQQDQLYVDGRINTGDWSYSGCEGLALNRSVAQVTDTGLSLGTVATGFGCGMWGFDEATNGQASFVSTDPVVGGYILLASGATGLSGATVQFDGMAMRPFNSYLTFATNTPVVSARVRISNLQHASSSITTVGFGNYTISGTAGVAGGAAGGFRYPTLGCWLTASSTQANWMAVCTNGSNATTTVNTGVATSSVFTGTPTGRFQDLRVEVSSTTAQFYIVTPGFPVASSSIPVAIIRTNIPLKTVITPIVSTTVVSPAAAGQASTLHVIRTKLWWKEPLN